MRNLISEYNAESSDLMPFYAQPARSIFTLKPAAGPWPTALVREINEYQTTLGVTTAIAGNESVIVTGQQPGLFTGPLYTIYKAITAIRLAERVQATTQTPCVPVFWIGSDDHDFEEARSAHFLTKSHEPLTLRYEPRANVDGLPMCRVPLEDSLREFVDRVAESTPGSEFRQEIANALHETLSAAQSLSDWSARILARLFQRTNLVFFSPHLPVSRTLAASVIEKEIAEPLTSTRLLNEAGDRLEALGFPRQITKANTECGFFLEVEGRRRKVLFEGSRYRVPDNELDFSIDDMLRVAKATPERLSPNVALRCLVQQRLFSAAAYVGGPGEVAYWAQLKPLFDHFDLPMPVVFPRAQCVLTTPKLAKLANRLGFTLADLDAPQEALVDRALRAAAKNPALDIVRQHRQRIDSSMSALTTDLARFGPAATMAEALHQKTMSEIDRIESTLLRADTAQADAIRKQVERLSNALLPWRKPQERVYTVFSFMFEHGWELIPRLLRTLDIESFAMNEVEL